MPTIAIEEHWMLPELEHALDALPGAARDDSLAFNELGDHAQRLHDLADGRLATMDELGIDVSVLSLTPPGTHPLAPADAVRLSRAANDRAAAAVARHPSRLRALSTLPMSSPKDVVAELERAAGLGHVGTMVYGRAGDVWLDDPVHDGFLAAAARLGQPVFIHPQLPSRALRDISYGGFDAVTGLALASFGWGWHTEAAISALRLIVRGTFDRHPDLQVVLGHWGEMLPFWLDRADSLSRIAGLERKVSDYIRSNFFITSSGMMNPAMLRHILSVTSVDRLMFSTDYPFQDLTAEQTAAFLRHFESDAEREAFMSRNAAALFGIHDVPMGR
ncbi:MAG TPA: amidohydrolase family protein [Pseudolysinimonas sp.]|nr:amidohydrolase family protein [Pseudolysinimonas sp.]